MTCCHDIKGHIEMALDIRHHRGTIPPEQDNLAAQM